MTLIEKLKKIRTVCTTNYWAHRLYAELCYMACLSSVREHIYDARIEEAADFLIAALDKTTPSAKRTGKPRKPCSPISPPPRSR